MTKANIKTEDYREITWYWFKRLCHGINNRNSKSEDAYYILCNYLNTNRVEEAMKHIKFKHFYINIMTLGYPKSTDLDRIITLEHKGISIAKGNEDWGAESDKFYFVIKHGKFIGS